MAGIFDRLGAATPGNNRIPSEVLHSAFILLADGQFTAQNILDALNSTVTDPLSGAELTDLSNIDTNVDNEVGRSAKLEYVTIIRAAFISAEAGLINDTQFRTILGIA